jgi:autotransporter-associated beta strand protein
MKTSICSTNHTSIVQRWLPVFTAALETRGAPWSGTLALLLGLLAVPARADISWDGDNPIGNFSYCDNWYGNSCPSQPWQFSYGNLVFNYRNNGNQTNLYYDLGWNNINDIIWETTFGVGLSLNGSGNGIYFNQRVENRSSYAQTVNIPLSGANNGAPQIELNPINADLTINGNIYNTNNKPFYSYGSNSKMLTIGVGLTGNSTVSFTVAAGGSGSSGKVKLTAPQSWGDGTHGVNINQGELWIDSKGGLQSGIPVSLGLADANTAKLCLSVAGGGTTFPQNITVYDSGGTKVLSGLNTSGTHTFTGNITLNGPVNLVADRSGGTVEFKTGVISGTSSVNINNTATSAGKIILSGANTYNGGTALSAGQLNINNGTAGTITSSAIGTGTFTISGGSIDNTSSGDVTLGPNNSQNWNGDFTYVGNAHNLNLGTGAVTLGGTRQLTVSANTLTVGGAIGDGGHGYGLIKTGTGTLTLSGANTFSGGTTLSTGYLYIAVGSLGTLGSASGALTVSGGTLDLGATSQTAGAVTIAGGVITDGTLTGSSYAAQSGIVRAVLAGSGVALTKTTSGTLNLWGSANNSYSGLTTVSEGTLTLAMTKGGLNAFGGDLTINGSGTVNYSTTMALDNQIPDTANVTLNTGSTLDLGGHNETIGQASPPAGSFTMTGGTLKVNGGTLTLGRNPSISGGTTQVSSTTSASGEVDFNADLTLSGGTLDMTAAGALVTGYRLQGGEGTGITYPSSGTATAWIKNSGGSTGAKLLIGPSSGSTVAYTTVLNIADAGGVDPELEVDVIMTNGLHYAGAINKTGTGRMLLTAANTFSGNITISTGTLSLGASGSINNVPILSIAAGATYDVSAISSYTLSSSTTLNASGTGAGTTAAAIKGASGGTVNLGSRPISLTYTPAGYSGDCTHPALYASQGTLSLNGNSFTVNNASGAALGYGTYTIIQQASGNITSAGSYSVSVTGKGKVANSTASVSVSGGTVLLTISCPSPMQLSMSGAGTFCTLGGAQTFGVSGATESDVTYALWKDGTAVDSRSGTGGAITFATQSAAGTYTVVGTRGSCMAAMRGSATINATPSTPSPSSDGPVCSGSTLHLSANTTSDSYNWTGPNGFTSTAQNPAISGITTAASGSYSLMVTANGCPSAAGTTTVTVNAAPAAPSSNVSSNVAPHLSLKIRISELLAAWSGSSLSFQSAGPNSTAGGTVTSDSTYIYYLPPGGTISSDSIPYTVSGANGCTTAAQIDVSFVPRGCAVQQITTSGGRVTIIFAGIPSYRYDVQRSDGLSFSSCDTVLTTNAPEAGVFTFTETPPGNSAYYRLMQQ